MSLHRQPVQASIGAVRIVDLVALGATRDRASFQPSSVWPMQQTGCMLDRRELVPAISRALLAIPDRLAHGLIVREIDTWTRLEFLGVMARSGVADALDQPRTSADIQQRSGVTDGELLDALLALGVALRELSVRGGRYRIRGRRLRAVAGNSTDLRGVVEELVAYDNPIYSALDAHLRGLEPQPYDANLGDVIAAASRIAEPVLGPTLRAVATKVQPSSVLDIGCGSGIYLHHVLEAVPTATGLGIDVNQPAVDTAIAQLSDLHKASRAEVRLGDIEVLADQIDKHDLVVLLNNIYYWPPEQRADILRTVGGVVAPGGTIVVATATPEGQPFNRHLDLMLRVTASSHRLPTQEELHRDLRAAQFDNVAIIEPIPKSGLIVATAQLP